MYNQNSILPTLLPIINPAIIHLTFKERQIDFVILLIRISTFSANPMTCLTIDSYYSDIGFNSFAVPRFDWCELTNDHLRFGGGGLYHLHVIRFFSNWQWLHKKLRCTNYKFFCTYRQRGVTIS